MPLDFITLLLPAAEKCARVALGGPRYVARFVLADARSFGEGAALMEPADARFAQCGGELAFGRLIITDGDISLAGIRLLFLFGSFF